MGVAGASVRVLGAVAAERDGADVDLGSRKQRAVLGLLVAARTHVVPVDRIIDELWQGEAPPKAMATLQAYVSRLRAVLEPGHGRRSNTVLVSVSPGYALRLPAEQVDAWRFEELVRDGEQQTDAKLRLARVDEALGLWRGTAFAEFADDEWAVPEVARLTELRLHARELQVDAALRAGACARAVIDGEGLVRDAPLREQAWRLLALAQYVADRQADALATLRRARDTLAEELGLDPGPALRELEQAILTQTVVLPADQPAPVGTAPRPSHEAPPVATTPSPSRERLPPAPALVVGRDAEAARLLAAAERVPQPGVGVGVVSGEPGAGKSVLMRGLFDQLRERGWLVAVGRCPEVDGSPPAWAWAEVMRSIAEQAPVGEFADALAPLLRDDAPPPAGDASQARFRMHQAAADWLSSLTSRPIAILLDDVHRADAETRRLLSSLVGKVTGVRLFFAISHRAEDADQLTELLADIAPLHPERISLAGLDRVAAGQLVTAVSGSRPNALVLSTLFERTDGNPFFLKEFARLLGSVGARELLKTVPAGVADVVRQRVARLPESAQAILRVAAAIGRVFDLDVLVEAVDSTDDVVFDAMEVGEIAGLLSDFGPGAMRFTHVLVRDTLYDDIPVARLRPMHRAIAGAIESVSPSDVTALAHHLALSASRSTADKAVEYCRAAAELAESRHAYDRTVELYRQALALLDLTDPQPRRRLDVLLRLIPALVLSGDTTAFIEPRREAVELARDVGDPHLLARAISCWYVTPWWIRDYAYVEADFITEATAELADAELDDAERSALLSAYLCEAFMRDDPTLVPTARQLLVVARRTGDPEVLCKALFAALMAHAQDGDLAERDAIRAELRDTAEAHALLSFHLLALYMEARAALRLGEVDRARTLLDECLPLAGKLELRWVTVALTECEGCLVTVTGDLDRAESIFRSIVDQMREHDPASSAADLTLAEVLFALRFAQDRLGEIVDIVRAAYDTYPDLFAASLACCLAAAGDEDAARSVLASSASEPLDPQFRTPRLGLRAFAALALDDRAQMAELYEKLVPYEHMIAGIEMGAPLEPIARTLGSLARRSGDAARARRHLERALAIATRCRNCVWIDRIRADLAEL